jgi:hypothetical protein
LNADRAPQLKAVVRHFSIEMVRRMITKLSYLALFVIMSFSPSSPQSAVGGQVPHRPKISFKHAKARHKELKTEIVRTIIKPLLCDSAKPIEEIIIDFCPEVFGMESNELGCAHEFEGKLTISITVNRFDGASAVAWVDRNSKGSFDHDIYLKIFAPERGDTPPKTGCAPKP